MASEAGEGSEVEVVATTTLTAITGVTTTQEAVATRETLAHVITTTVGLHLTTDLSQGQITISAPTRTIAVVTGEP